MTKVFCKDCKYYGIDKLSFSFFWGIGFYILAGISASLIYVHKDMIMLPLVFILIFVGSILISISDRICKRGIKTKVRTHESEYEEVLTAEELNTNNDCKYYEAKRR